MIPPQKDVLKRKACRQPGFISTACFQIRHFSHVTKIDAEILEAEFERTFDFLSFLPSSM